MGEGGSGGMGRNAEIEALIFDFDGLLIDSESPLLEIWQEIYRQYGCELTMDQWQHALGTFGGFDPYADILARTGKGPERATLQPTIRARHFELCAAMPLMPGVADVLAEARAAGLKTAVASSSAEDWVGPFLRQHGLDILLDAICTRDDVKQVKPAPDLFLLAAERMRVAPGALRRIRGFAERPARRARGGHVGHRGAERADASAAAARSAPRDRVARGEIARRHHRGTDRINQAARMSRSLRSATCGG